MLKGTVNSIVFTLAFTVHFGLFLSLPFFSGGGPTLGLTFILTIILLAFLYEKTKKETDYNRLIHENDRIKLFIFDSISLKESWKSFNTKEIIDIKISYSINSTELAFRLKKERLYITFQQINKGMAQSFAVLEGPKYLKDAVENYKNLSFIQKCKSHRNYYPKLYLKYFNEILNER